MPGFASVLITGASSGIGRALAMECAGPGVRLHLGGRDAARLEEAAKACRGRGADVAPGQLDVRDEAAMAEWIGSAGRLDLVIANAGISAGTGLGTPETPTQTRTIFAVNVGGVLNTVLPALELMQAQAPDDQGVRGRIAVIASIAAFFAASGAPSYCAAKSAVDTWTVASAPVAQRAGVLLTSACPGFINTPMTAGNPFPMPGLMSAERAAKIILRDIAAGRRRIIFPWWMGAAARFAALLPPRLAEGLTAGRPAKPGLPDPA
jgi:NAD(P)-dependent dehydrogenase (short-subunit alcohol dehydrogenase family)